MPSREELAAAMMRDVQGLDARGYDVAQDPDEFGADDPIKRAGLSTIQILFTQASGTALAVNLFAESDLDNASLPTGLTSVNGSATVGAYHRMIRYLQANPAQIHSVLIQSSETASGGAPILSTMTITPTRITPFGLNTSNQLLVNSFQTTQDFQANRVSVPLVAALDAFSYLAFATATQSTGSPITFTTTLFFGKRQEIRAGVRRGTPMAVRPGGRGMVPVKRPK